MENPSGVFCLNKLDADFEFNLIGYFFLVDYIFYIHRVVSNTELHFSYAVLLLNTV